MSGFIIYCVIALVWFFYRAVFRFPEPVDEFLFKPLIFLLPIFLWVRLKERKSLVSLGISKGNLFKSLLIGLFFGLFFAAEGVAVSAIKYKEVVFNPKNLGVLGLAGYSLLSLATGFSEEVLNRGFLMNRLWKKWGNEYLANFVSAFLFTLTHLPAAIFVLKYHLPYDFLTYGLSIFVLGFADGFVFARTKNIFAPTISHALWNWSVILFK